MMAVYLINSEYVFNEKTKEFKKLHSDVNIKLTSMRARCLSYIIEHAKDEVIEKEAISQALWGSRSKFTSDASLTQTLYLIRRDLKFAGLDEFFITVPKSGIRVSTSATVEVMEEKTAPGKRVRPWWWLLGVVVSLLVLGSALFLTLQL
ncbi:DNA-binding winged helix-turn-helix (wHTH) protein [Rahnella sp. BIGb0236]|uniref:winged helix-turn-helix domain-containing protein n=1 Tax=Rahnella sp. BIGb0236 TaxID=2485117 RepID=UPI00105FEB67|nr:winged helix-turn-helix domain-containing protein [Rahnella sp. BIGb0236]TDS92494.1 DNA-binding winged helix-turn-helix (wHTH) protein [Rahnella sp. BIGb0236]